MTKTHFKQKPIPTDPDARRERIQWVLNHLVWTHPATITVPCEGEDWFFQPTPTSTIGIMREPDDTWVEKEIQEGSFYDCVDIDFAYVNPLTERIDTEDGLNTAFRVWVEADPWHDQSGDEIPGPKEGWNDHNKWMGYHDTRLDCGGTTAEEALLELASLVEVFYNEDGTEKDMPYQCMEEPCESDARGFCVKCGYRVEESA